MLSTLTLPPLLWTSESWQWHKQMIARLHADSSLRLEQVPLALTEGEFITCDVSTGVQRPYVPQSFRKAIFDILHDMSHPGICATQRLVTSHFVWPNINTDVLKVLCIYSHV